MPGLRPHLSLVLLVALASSSLLLVSLIIVQANSPIHPAKGTSPPPQLHRTIWLNGSALGNSGWNLTRPGPTISVNSGDRVSLMLKSADGLLHQWFIDFNNNSILDPDELFFSPTFNHPSVWINYTFTPVIGVNVTRAGTWEYLCTFHGYAMFGRITINQAPDFTLSASPNSVSLKPGSSANSTITLTSLGSFSGLVNLSSIANSTSLSVSLNISSLQFTTDGLA